MNIPTREDWGESEPNDLDFRSTFKDFFGSSQAEAQELFADNALAYGEGLYYMKGVVFSYYLQSFKTYLLSQAANGNADGASSFISMLDFKSTKCPSDLLPNWSDLDPLLEKLATDQDFFEADWFIYGDFRWRIGQIVRRGFPVSFDTSAPEFVPPDATIMAMAHTSHKSLSLEAAVQVIHNSGFTQFHSQLTRTELKTLFGEPEESGGGFHQALGITVLDWVAYHRAGARIHIFFEGEEISSISFT